MLVIVGENENKLMKKSAKDIVNSNPNRHGILISGVGHGLPLTNPELFNKMVKDWIEKQGNMEDEKFQVYRN